MPTKFRIGDGVEDRESAKPGRVVHVYREIDIRDDVVVVLFDDKGTRDCEICIISTPVAFSISPVWLLVSC
jgi:hypothetical protein